MGDNTHDIKTEYQRLKCRVYLVKESSDRRKIKLESSQDVYNLVKDELCSSDREIFLSILLSTNNTLIGIETVAVGTLNSVYTSPREIFKSAILANADSIILCHNHPSGSLTPSSDDIKITNTIIKSGELLGIKVIDHLLVSSEGFRSLIHSYEISKQQK